MLLKGTRAGHRSGNRSRRSILSRLQLRPGRTLTLRRQTPLTRQLRPRPTGRRIRTRPRVLVTRFYRDMDWENEDSD